MASTPSKMVLSVTLGILVFILCTDTLRADQSIEAVQIASHSLEGNVERIAFTFAEPVEEDLYLEVYEFHYIMFPELAPREDTWNHEKQMAYMTDVLNGTAKPYSPSLSDASVQQILEISPEETIKLISDDDRQYYTEWKAEHGRIFFRVKTDSAYVDQQVYSMRVHCSHIDMRSVEKLKDLLSGLKMPLEHKNSFMANNIYKGLFAVYTQGHGLQFMMKHHDFETADLDNLFQHLSIAIRKSDFSQANNLLVSLKEEVRAAEQHFYRLRVTRNNEIVNIRVEDRINAYPFHLDESVELYIKEYREPTGAELATMTHGVDLSPHDPTAHLETMKPDKGKLTEGAIRLERISDSFEGTLAEQWDSVAVVVLYGADQGYYLTNVYSLR